MIESLKKLSDNQDIASVVDIGQVIRYFVVHNYVCNDDSYTGMMVHNYYLYETDGRLSMIPWDYNLGFGTFGGGNATSTVNTPIDTPVSGGSSDRPMLNWIFESEEYTALYHQYFAEFLNSVDIQGIINNTYDLIQSYVEKDPTAFYTYEEFELGVETLRQFCNLRSSSISMQLDNGETADNMSYVDASAITLSGMGSMGGEGGRGGGMGGFGGDMSGMPEGFTGEMPEGFGSFNLPEGFNPSNPPDNASGNFPGQFSGSQTEATPSEASGTAGDNNTSRPAGGVRQMPGDDFRFHMDGTGNPASNQTGWIWIGASAAVLAIGLAVAKIYKH